MVYVGSKSRLAKYLVPRIQAIIDIKHITTYIEPFVGGANIIDKIRCNKKIGYDIHSGLIDIYNSVKTGWVPPLHITEDEYNSAKNLEEPLKSYIGFTGSYASKYFGGFARTSKRDIYNERTRNFLKQIPNLLDIQFETKNFIYVQSAGALIYCDPPYANTTKYSTEAFNHEIFWNWVREQSRNNIVLVSEFIAPKDFKCIWSKERAVSLDKDIGRKKNTERLFVIR